MAIEPASKRKVQNDEYERAENGGQNRMAYENDQIDDANDAFTSEYLWLKDEIANDIDYEEERREECCCEHVAMMALQLSSADENQSTNQEHTAQCNQDCIAERHPLSQ